MCVSYKIVCNCLVVRRGSFSGVLFFCSKQQSALAASRGAGRESPGQNAWFVRVKAWMPSAQAKSTSWVCPPQEREKRHPHLRCAEQKFQLFRGEKDNVCPGEQLPGDLPRGRFPFRLGPEGRLQAGHKAGQGPGIPGGGEGR